VDFGNGRQVPCAPPEMMYRGARITGFVPPQKMRFYVDNVAVQRVSAISTGSFALTVAYDIKWSDRFAVHPCKIPLYAYGSGVPSNGKLVPASAWWKPNPAKGDNAAISFAHSSMLKVHHTVPTADEVGAPGALVTKACTTLTCAWPKQLFLRSRITAEVSVSASWDLTQYPFDKQMLRMELPLLDGDSFTSYDVDDALVQVALSSVQAKLATSYAGLYKPSDWIVYSADVQFLQPSTLVFEIKVARNSASTIFKYFIPFFANALLICLATRQANKARLKIVAFSLLVSSTMLNPSFLGLPGTVQGIPFLQSLVVIQMAIAVLVLVYTMSIFFTDWWFEQAVEDEARKYIKSHVGVYKKHVGTYEKWSKWFLEQGMKDPPPGFGDPTFFADHPKQSTLGKVLFGSGGSDKKTAPVTPVQVPPPAQSQGATASEEVEPVLLPPPTNATQPIELLQRATIELLLGLPALFHRQDPSRPPKIFNPFGELRPGHLPPYNKVLIKRGDYQRRFEAIIPFFFLLMWLVDYLVYFVAIDGEPQSLMLETISNVLENVANPNATNATA